MNSPGHRENVLGDYTERGAAQSQMTTASSTGAWTSVLRCPGSTPSCRRGVLKQIICNRVAGQNVRS